MEGKEEENAGAVNPVVRSRCVRGWGRHWHARREERQTGESPLSKLCIGETRKEEGVDADFGKREKAATIVGTEGRVHMVALGARPRQRRKPAGARRRRTQIRVRNEVDDMAVGWGPSSGEGGRRQSQKGKGEKEERKEDFGSEVERPKTD